MRIFLGAILIVIAILIFVARKQKRVKNETWKIIIDTAQIISAVAGLLTILIPETQVSNFPSHIVSTNTPTYTYVTTETTLPLDIKSTSSQVPTENPIAMMETVDALSGPFLNETIMPRVNATVDTLSFRPITHPPFYEEDKPDDYDQQKCDWLLMNFPQSLDDERLRDIFPLSWPINASEVNLFTTRCPSGIDVVQGATIYPPKNGKITLAVPEHGCIDIFTSTASISGPYKEMGDNIIRAYPNAVIYTDGAMNYYHWCNEVNP